MDHIGIRDDAKNLYDASEYLTFIGGVAGYAKAITMSLDGRLVACHNHPFGERWWYMERIWGHSDLNSIQAWAYLDDGAALTLGEVCYEP